MLEKMLTKIKYRTIIVISMFADVKHTYVHVRKALKYEPNKTHKPRFNYVN